MSGISPAALGAALRGDFANAMLASTPGGIEAQERAGRDALVAAQTYLPKKMHFHAEKNAQVRAYLEAQGFVFGADVDDIFVSVKFPEGWKIVATEHDMNSNLVDPQGRVRGNVFYKAAFYDRNSHLHLDSRYRLHPRAEGSYATEKCRAGILDCGKVIWLGEEYASKDYAVSTKRMEVAEAMLDKMHPDWKNPFAYWD